jgi:hypothetical protein
MDRMIPSFLYEIAKRSFLSSKFGIVAMTRSRYFLKKNPVCFIAAIPRVKIYFAIHPPQQVQTTRGCAFMSHPGSKSIIKFFFSYLFTGTISCTNASSFAEFPLLKKNTGNIHGIIRTEA